MNIRIALSVVLCIAVLPAASGTIPVPARAIDLDRPGALDTIQRENPSRYRRITEIISLAETMPCQSDQFPRMLEARYDARGWCGAQLLTSYPAKRRFSFTLDATSYQAIVTMRDSGGTLLPAQQRAR